MLEAGIHSYNASWLPQNFLQWEQEIMQPSRMRFMIVRNPYARILSGFLDKCISNPWGNVRCPGMPYSRTAEDFARFVEVLYDDYMVKQVHVNTHFTPLVDHCGLPKGFKYHFYLKSEEIDVWYPGFVSYVGLESSVKSGWGYTDATPDCFHPLGGMTCKQTDLAIRHRRASPAGAKDEDQLPSFTMHAVDKHSTGADKLLEMFYTKEVAERVYQLYKADFKEFGYEKMESSA